MGAALAAIRAADLERPSRRSARGLARGAAGAQCAQGLLCEQTADESVIALAFGLLCAAALLGGGLAIRLLRASQKPPPAAIALFHGALGAASLALLLAALRRGPPRRGMGIDAFGPIAAGLLALAFVLGLIFLWGAAHGNRPAETLVGAHALFALGALVMLLAVIVLS